MSGYVDLQVNGYAGVDFNSNQLTQQQIADLIQRLDSDGVDQILATVITDGLDSMMTKIGVIADAIESSPIIASKIAGIHVEGPFLNPEPGYVGAHPVEHVKSASIDATQRLLDAGRGHVRLLTLAPEMDGDCCVTKFLTEHGIVVAAGHCDTSREELQRAIDHGLRLFTHLGNGCPSLLPRHDNIIQRVLSLADRLMISFIADGHHVPDFSLRNYLSCVPSENVIIVTDAISAAGLGPGRYQLGEQWVEVDPDGAAWAEGREHFAGCATTMSQMSEILLDRVKQSEADIDRWTRLNPSRLMTAG